jgi:hypothetical protein
MRVEVLLQNITFHQGNECVMLHFVRAVAHMAQILIPTRPLLKDRTSRTERRGTISIQHVRL